MLTTLLSVAGVCLGQPDLPTVTVFRDDTVINESCRVIVPKGTFIQDANGDGVIHIEADDITVEFVDGEAELIAAPEGTPWETLTGVGIRVDGRKNVTLRGAHSHRFKVGILATNADGLVLENCDVAGGYAMRLGSTPEREDGADWLWPHNNAEHQWRDTYGAGICIENSSGVTVRSCYARRRQNGMILDRVTKSKIYDNDFSFLSGWGIAMWRSDDNVISRNALDFCVRGYSHGVYNRGQDSAGILMFEQCNRNVIAENSVTHGGDGIFGFGGVAARGDDWLEAERRRLRRQVGREDIDAQIDPPDDIVAGTKRNGCNDNLIIGNDLSYASAHGFEMTFSFGNKFLDNRVVGNAICGVWGGYSQETLIAGNLFEANGEFGYGLERGGVNIEHGYDNTIQDNRFKNNKCGVHLWWDPDPGLTVGPWAEANHHVAPAHEERALASHDNFIVDNRFEDDEVAIHLRDADRTVTAGNEFIDVGKVLDADPASTPTEIGMTTSWGVPEHEVIGSTRPVGARAELRGRDKIIMGEYFPWDHEAPLARAVGSRDGATVIELLGFKDGPVIKVEGDVKVVLGEPDEMGVRELRFEAAPGVHPYTVEVAGEGFERTFSGTMMSTSWDVVVFPWEVDPREDLEAWRKLANGGQAVRTTVGTLNLPYGGGGPRDVLGLGPEAPGGNHFGTIAKASLALPAGTWRFTTMSDDGVRVIVDGKPVIENWTWHGPTENEGIFGLFEDAEVEIVVEHFEIDGWAVLELRIERADGP
jgi:nitrous oxidase accessory protein NosD